MSDGVLAPAIANFRMLITKIAPILLALFLCMPSTSLSAVEWGKTTIIKPIEDPRALPYRFEQGYTEQCSPDGRTIHWAFVSPEFKEEDGVFRIEENWRPPDTMTAVVFSATAYIADARSQENIHAFGLEDWLAYDYDGDNDPELAALFLCCDTLWLTRRDPGSDAPPLTRALCTGKDRNEDGRWDVTGYILAAEDVDADGFTFA